MKYPTWSGAALNSYRQGYGLRFLEDLVLWSRVKLFGWQPEPYFAISLLQNFLAAVLVFTFAQQLFHRTKISFLAGLIFVAAFPPTQVVTWITGSNVSLLALFYAGTLVLYIQALRTRRVGWHLAAWACFVLAMFSGEYSITLFPALVLLTLVLWRELDLRPWRLALLLLPYSLVLVPYAWYQLLFLGKGTSEGAGLGGYRLGWQVFDNFTNLAHLLIPDLHFPRVVNTLQARFPLGLQILVLLDPLVKVLGLAVTAIVLIKGSARTQFLMLFIYLAYAPFTLWVRPDIAHSPRYLYLPLIAFSILLSLFLARASEWLAGRRLASKRLGNAAVWLAVLLAMWLGYNAIPIYIYQAQEVANGQVRRNVIEQIRVLHPQLPAGSTVYLELPDKSFRDLEFGVPQFYTTTFQVVAAPPGVIPARIKSTDYVLQYQGGRLLEQR